MNNISPSPLTPRSSLNKKINIEKEIKAKTNTNTIEKNIDNNHPSKRDFLIVRGHAISSQISSHLFSQEDVKGHEIEFTGKNLQDLIDHISQHCGPDTNIILRVHGWMNEREKDSHAVIFSDNNKESIDTSEVIHAIRNMKVKNGKGELVPFKGNIHVSSCGVGVLEKAAHLLKEAGPVFLYAGDNQLSHSTDFFMISNLVNVLKENKGNDRANIDRIVKALLAGLGGVGNLYLIEQDRVIAITTRHLPLPDDDNDNDEDHNVSILSHCASDSMTAVSVDTMIALYNSIKTGDRGSLQSLLQLPEIKDNINGKFVPVFNLQRPEISEEIESWEIPLLFDCVTSRKANSDSIQFVLKSGANPCLTNEQGDTPLLAFCRKFSMNRNFRQDAENPMQIVSLLARRMNEIDPSGTSINLKDSKGMTVLDYAGSNIEMISILVAQGARFAPPVNGSLFTHLPREKEINVDRLCSYLYSYLYLLSDHFSSSNLKNNLKNNLKKTDEEKLTNFKQYVGAAADNQGNTWEMQLCSQYDALCEYLSPEARKIFKGHIGLIMSQAKFNHKNEDGKTLVDVVIQSNSPVIAAAFLEEHLRRLNKPASDEEHSAAEALNEKLIKQLIDEPDAWSSHHNRRLFKSKLGNDKNIVEIDFNSEEPLNAQQLDQIFAVLDEWALSKNNGLRSQAKLLLTSSKNSARKHYISQWIGTTSTLAPNMLFAALKGKDGIRTWKFELILHAIETAHKELKNIIDAKDRIIALLDYQLSKNNDNNASSIAKRNSEIEKQKRAQISLGNLSASIGKLLTQLDTTGVTLAHHLLIEEHDDGIDYLITLIEKSGKEAYLFLDKTIAAWAKNEKITTLTDEALLGENGFNEDAILFIFKAAMKDPNWNIYSDYFQFIKEYFNQMLVNVASLIKNPEERVPVEEKIRDLYFQKKASKSLKTMYESAIKARKDSSI